MNVTSKNADAARPRHQLLGYVDPDAVVGITAIVAMVVFFVFLASITPGRQHRPRVAPAADRAGVSHRVPPRQSEAPADDPDLALFKSFLKYVNDTSYGGTFPLGETVVGWGVYTGSTPNVYAFSNEDGGRLAIYLVPDRYQRDWNFNVEVARHEMSHLAVGTRHDHDAVFQRELQRLRDGRVVKSFEQVQAESGS